MPNQEQQQAFVPSPTMIWIIRGVLLVLYIVWIVGAVYLHQVVKADEAAIAQREQVLMQQEERARRAARLEQSRLQDILNRDSSKNAVDGFKR